MQFTTTILFTLAAVASATPAPNANAAEHADLVRRLSALSEANSNLAKRECDKEGYKKCADPCDNFNRGPYGGISWALCLVSCNNIYGPGC